MRTPGSTLAVVAQRRGDPEAARQFLEGLLREAPEHPVGRALRDELERLARLRPPRRPERPWALALSVVGGYNSNVIALGDTIPLPEDITRKDAGFARVTVGGSYAWRPTPVDTLTAGYTFLAEVYDGLSDADVLDHFWYLDYRHLLRPDLIAGLRVSDEFTQLGGDDFRNQVAVRPAVGYRIVDWLAAELAYTVAVSDYYFLTDPVQDRDGLQHTVALTAFLTVPGTRLEVRAGYVFVANNADGADLDFDSQGPDLRPLQPPEQSGRARGLRVSPRG